jgi:uncharacterized protein with HEPN domain
VKENRPYLQHINDALTAIREYTNEGREGFFNDRKTQDAVIRNLEIIGEATKRLSPDFRDAHPECPWKQMAGMRDKVIHDYLGVNLEIVWETVETRVPRLLEQIDVILAAQQEDDPEIPNASDQESGGP